MRPTSNFQFSILNSQLKMVWNLFLAYATYFVCRVAFLWENWAMFADNKPDWLQVLKGGFIFDSSAIFYTNLLYALLVLIPLFIGHNGNKVIGNIQKIVFVVINSVAVVTNLVDCVYAQYTGRRTTTTVFREFESENNLGSIIGTELLSHWYLVLLGVALIVMLWLLYKDVSQKKPERRKSLIRYILLTLNLVLYLAVSVVAMRGGVSTAIRPIAVSNANQYVRNPSQASLVLNTPFSLIRTLGKNVFKDPNYFENPEQYFSPLHQFEASEEGNLKGKNVVILILESFSSEYIEEGYAPFTDSLLHESLTFSQSYANGRKSIDAMPSILASIPMFIEPYVLTPASLNPINSVASLLNPLGYRTAFFHGAENSSMGFQAFAKAAGFQYYYGRNEYDQEPRFGGEKDFDGTWAIWDEPFLQYYAEMMDTLPQPFLTALFTASSHHPFAIPQQYEQRFHQGPMAIHRCVRYSDNALRQFFITASKMPWYSNTLFVLTADHTNMLQGKSHAAPIAPYRVPIAFFDPSGKLPRGTMDAVAQQIDIMPTLLSMLGYEKPFVAFGIDLMTTPPEKSWAVNYNNGLYQYITLNEFIQFDGSQTMFHATLSADRQGTTLTPNQNPGDLTQLKAIIQSYMRRMTNNEMTITE